MKISLTVNGARRSADVPPMKRLLDVLREDLALTGTKEGCGEGECGACSVLLDGELANSCLVPACQADGAKVLTVEGIGSKKKLHPLQQAFWEHGGAQCGICTPGMLVASLPLVSRPGRLTGEDVREGLAGNLCRCTGYMKIVESVLAAHHTMAGAAGKRPARTAKRPGKKPGRKPAAKAKKKARRAG